MNEFMMSFNRNTFSISPDVVNAYYSYTENGITLPAGILQFPFFLSGQPQSLNYGSIGFTIGHEITHGFDKIGKDFDDQGNAKNWWTEATLEHYKANTQCMIDQYDAVEVANTNGMRINGAQTITENVADNGGIRESYRAYKRYLENNGPEKTLPGISATSEQLFFYGFANSWCSVDSPRLVKQQVASDSHSPNKERANTVLQNTPEFSAAFKCPLGSPMNPVKKCSVW